MLIVDSSERGGGGLFLRKYVTPLSIAKLLLILFSHFILFKYFNRYFMVVREDGRKTLHVYNPTEKLYTES